MAKIHSYSCGVLFVIYLAGVGPGWAQLPSNNNRSTSVGPVTEFVNGMVDNASRYLENGQLDDALRSVDSAIQVDPKNAKAYELRGNVYMRKKLWDRAESDFAMAAKIVPGFADYKYRLAELKFVQKAYDEARPRFLPLVSDPDLGDLAAFKVFLCDLLTDHQDRATAELAALSKNHTNGSYFYANAAWDLAHNNRKDAGTLLGAAQQQFGPENNYIVSLQEVNRIQAILVSFISKDGTPYEQVRAFVENDGLRVGTMKGWVTVPFSQLPDDLSSFPQDFRREVEAKRAPVAAPSSPKEFVTFTTKLGKSYSQVSASMGERGLELLTPDGLINVRDDELPDDLSPFPDDLRKQIVAWRQSRSVAVDDTALVTFTTKQGKTYDNDRVSVQDYGLVVLTPDGRVTVPFSQLPDDLSAFPDAFRKQITATRESAPTASDAPVRLSFTTRKGKTYDEVRVSVVETGLQALTSDGAIIVPFDQLPEDLSPFPAEMRPQIIAAQDALATKRRATPPTPNGKVEHGAGTAPATISK
ncbi:MAG TPA: tetratricopeptide repeat protein [Candidatus Methylacidiphilales bacterium]